MGEIADLSDLVNRMTGGASGTPEHINWYRDARTNGAAATATVAGRYTSLWRYEGIPSSGAVPGASPLVPTNATAGALKQTDSSGGRTKYLIGADATAIAPGTLLIYDRLLHISGMAGTNTAPQSVGGTLTRNTTGVGNEIWIEIYTIIGTSATTITASYTNQDGDAATTVATAIGGTGLREAERLIRLPLAVGDTGVQGVTSITLAGTTGTVGDFGVTVARPLLSIPVSTNAVLGTKDLISGFPAMLPIEAGACLSLAWLANATTAPIAMGSLHFVEA
jgi:hypothetical protein